MKVIVTLTTLWRVLVQAKSLSTCLSSTIKLDLFAWPRCLTERKLLCTTWVTNDFYAAVSILPCFSSVILSNCSYLKFHIDIWHPFLFDLIMHLLKQTVSAVRYCFIQRWHICREKNWHTNKGCGWQRQLSGVWSHSACRSFWAQSCRLVSAFVHFHKHFTKSSRIPAKFVLYMQDFEMLVLQVVCMCAGEDIDPRRRQNSV